jgi:hypothetical protein
MTPHRSIERADNGRALCVASAESCDEQACVPSNPSIEQASSSRLRLRSPPLMSTVRRQPWTLGIARGSIEWKTTRNGRTLPTSSSSFPGREALTPDLSIERTCCGTMRLLQHAAHVQQASGCTMRIASRHMPKLQPHAVGPARWLLLLMLGAGAAYVALSAPKPFFAVVGVLMVLVAEAGLRLKRDHRKLRALAATRHGQTICEFARDFDARAVDTWIIRAVYEQLQAQLEHVHPAFPVRADDRLKEDLFLDDDDLDMDLAQEV